MKSDFDFLFLINETANEMAEIITQLNPKTNEKAVKPFIRYSFFDILWNG